MQYGSVTVNGVEIAYVEEGQGHWHCCCTASPNPAKRLTGT